MSNLIITIISIGLIAVAALMGIYYGGTAYANAQINATANSIMNEAQQILYAERIWSTNNNQPDISGMGTAGASGTGMAMLVSSNALAEWPSFAGTMGMAYQSPNTPGPQPYLPGTGLSATTVGTYDYGCYSINGYMGRMARMPFAYKNGNYVLLILDINIPYTAPCNTDTGVWAATNTDVSNANHPIVKIAKAINTALNQIPANANLATMPYIGLPRLPSGSIVATSTTIYDPSNGQYIRIYFDGNGTIQTNYCYLIGTSNAGISCVFGPS